MEKNQTSGFVSQSASIATSLAQSVEEGAEVEQCTRIGGECGNRGSEQRGPCGGSGFFWKRFAQRRGRQSRGVKVIFATGFPSFLRAALGETTTSQTWEQKENIGLSYQKVKDKNN